jgi:hypothetical protein
MQWMKKIAGRGNKQLQKQIVAFFLTQGYSQQLLDQSRLTKA